MKTSRTLDLKAGINASFWLTVHTCFAGLRSPSTVGVGSALLQVIPVIMHQLLPSSSTVTEIGNWAEIHF